MCKLALKRRYLHTKAVTVIGGAIVPVLVNIPSDLAKLAATLVAVFAVNPKAIGGEPCYPNLKAIPGGVDEVVVVTTPEVTEQIVQQAIEAGVRRVWMHNSMGDSVSRAAVEACRLLA